MNDAPSNRGFTLAEALVVLGIVALLMGLLLPVLARARQAARATACAAQQRGIAQAALAGAAQTGYLPLAGEVAVLAGLSGYGSLPAALGDPGRRRYGYGRDWLGPAAGAFTPFGEQVLPPPHALLRQLGDADPDVPAESQSDWRDALAAHDVLSVFACPEGPGRTYLTGEHMISFDAGHPPVAGWGSVWFTASDYAFNGGACGFHFDPRFAPSRRRGRLVDVGPAGQVVLLADAATDFPTGGGHMWFGPRLSEEPEAVTLADAAGPTDRVEGGTRPESRRHGGRANVAFADGHVNAVASADLAEAVLTPGP